MLGFAAVLAAVGLVDVALGDPEAAVLVLLKVGLRKDVEPRAGGNGLMHQTRAATPSASGLGDTTLGAQWCYLRNGPLGMDEAVQLTLKVPTASAPKGLGSGEPDETLMLLLRRDLGPFHADANILATRLGRPAAEGGGAVFQPAATLSLSRALDERLVLDAGLDVGLSHGAQKLSLFAGLTVGMFRVRRPPAQ